MTLKIVNSNTIPTKKSIHMVEYKVVMSISICDISSFGIGSTLIFDIYMKYPSFIYSVKALIVWI